MKLGKKQEEFSICLAKFVVWIYCQGWKIRWGEVLRTKEQAEIYAREGKGILNSVHRKKLAADVYLSKRGKVVWGIEDYRDLGDKWKSLHPLARWGGDFRRRDVFHFSFEHNGVR